MLSTAAKFVWYKPRGVNVCLNSETRDFENSDRLVHLILCPQPFWSHVSLLPVPVRFLSSPGLTFSAADEGEPRRSTALPHCPDATSLSHSHTPRCTIRASLRSSSQTSSFRQDGILNLAQLRSPPTVFYPHWLLRIHTGILSAPIFIYSPSSEWKRKMPVGVLAHGSMMMLVGGILVSSFCFSLSFAG